MTSLNISAWLFAVSIEDKYGFKKPSIEKQINQAIQYQRTRQQSFLEDDGFLTTMRSMRLHRTLEADEKFEIVKKNIHAYLQQHGIAPDEYLLIYQMDTIYRQPDAARTYGIKQSGQLDVFVYFKKDAAQKFAILKEAQFNCLLQASRNDGSVSQVQNRDMESYMAELILSNFYDWFHDVEIPAAFNAHIILNAMDVLDEKSCTNQMVSKPIQIESSTPVVSKPQPVVSPPKEPEYWETIKKNHAVVGKQILSIKDPQNKPMDIHIEIYSQAANNTSQEFATISFFDGQVNHLAVIDLQPEKRYSEVRRFLYSWYQAPLGQSQFEKVDRSDTPWDRILFALLAQKLSDEKLFPQFKGSEFLKDIQDISTGRIKPYSNVEVKPQGTKENLEIQGK